MNRIFKSKTVQVILLIIFAGVAVYFTSDLTAMMRRENVRTVSHGINAAWDEAEKIPTGPARIEVFLKKLKAIDTHNAPADVKDALGAYTTALQKGWEAEKAGADFAVVDREIDEKKTALINVLEKYLTRYP